MKPLTQYLSKTFLTTPICLWLAANITYFVYFSKHLPVFLWISLCFFGLAVVKSFTNRLHFLIMTFLTLFAFLFFTNLSSSSDFIDYDESSHISGFIKNYEKGRSELVLARINNKVFVDRVYVTLPEEYRYPESLEFIEVETSSQPSIYRENILTINVKKGDRIRAEKNWLSSSIRFVSSRINSTSKKYFNENASLVKAMVFGLDDLSNEEKDNFRELGLSHVLVASGANIMMIMSCLSFVFSKIRFKGSRFVEFIVILAYVMLVGFEGSIARALFFFIVNYSTRYLGREIDYLEKILLTINLMILAFPSFVFGLSFLLSLVATLALKLGEDLNDLMKVKNNLIRNFIQNVVIIFSVNFLISHVFGEFNLTGLISNMIVLFIVEMIVTYGFGFVVGFVMLDFLNFSLLNHLGNLFAAPLNFMINIFNMIINAIQSILGTKFNLEFEISFNQMILFYIIVIVLWSYMIYLKYKVRIQELKFMKD